MTKDQECRVMKYMESSGQTQVLLLLDNMYHLVTREPDEQARNFSGGDEEFLRVKTLPLPIVLPFL